MLFFFCSPLRPFLLLKFRSKFHIVSHQSKMPIDIFLRKEGIMASFVGTGAERSPVTRWKICLVHTVQAQHIVQGFVVIWDSICTGLGSDPPNLSIT